MVEIGKKRFHLKSNLDSALRMIKFARMKALNGRGSAKSLDMLTEERPHVRTSRGFRRSFSEGSLLDIPDEDDSIEQNTFADSNKELEPQFTVLVANRYPSNSTEKVPWDESCNFSLEEVHAYGIIILWLFNIVLMNIVGNGKISYHF